ncbi:MAG: glycosyltransferase family 4 protein [Deltaproteobacteria bacterium]|nr:glycosyltransferase family 4 protein [Deltaproteobacteria bacterium]
MAFSPDSETNRRPRVMIVGGPDVDARLELMGVLADDFEFVVAGSDHALKTRFENRGYEFYYYPLERRNRPWLDVYACFKLWKVFREARPHLVHTYDTKPSIWGRYAARLAGVPVVAGTLPGLGSLYSSDAVTTRVLRSAYRVLQKIACEFTDSTVLQNTGDWKQLTDEGVLDPSKATVILGSGVDTEYYAPDQVADRVRENLREELGIAEGKVIVLLVSRVMRTKGILEYAEAAENLKEDLPDAEFVLVGPHDDESRDHLTPGELDAIQSRLKWLGPRSDVRELMALSDVLVLPTAYREGIPRVLLEGASMGLPLIATDSPGCNEVVVPGENGYFVEQSDAQSLAEAIRKLVSEPALRRDFGVRSREFAVSKFELGVVAGKIKALHLDLLRSKGLC